MTEVIERKFGYIRDAPHADAKLLLRPHLIAALPTRYIINDLTPVEDQGQLGSCTGNASDNASKIRGAVVGANWFNGSRLAMYYLARLHDGTVQDGDVGSTLSSVAWVLENQGIAAESLWQYNVNEVNAAPPQTYMSAALKDETTKATRLDASDESITIANIKSSVVAGYPVMLGFTVFNDFFNTDFTGNMPMGRSGGVAGGHAVCGLGYDDAHGNSDGSVGAVLIKNSWGVSFGCKKDGTTSNGSNGGYFWMPYNYFLDLNDSVGDVWAIINENDFPAPPPTPAVGQGTGLAAKTFNGAMYDFCQGTNNACYVQHTTDGVTWTGWAYLGGICTSAPAAEVFANRLFVFVRGSDKAGWVISMDTTGKWSAWKSLGGVLEVANASLN